MVCGYGFSVRSIRRKSFSYVRSVRQLLFLSAPHAKNRLISVLVVGIYKEVIKKTCPEFHRAKLKEIKSMYKLKINERRFFVND
jgi:hypothetical protein